MQPLKLPLAAMLTVSFASATGHAQQPSQTPTIDYASFQQLTSKLATYRQSRLIKLDRFNEMSTNGKAIILDSRSAAAFAQGHIEGAINIPFSDFTQDTLLKILGKDKSRMILIYCNNNFSDDLAPVALKSAPLALNIPTFINLYGYGYKNIYELSGSYKMQNPDIKWRAGKSL